jgi:hypothetical protein
VPPIIISCPQCGMQLRVPETMVAGTKVKCPKCTVTFETPDPSTAPPPLPSPGAIQPSPQFPGAPLPPTASGRPHDQDVGGPQYQRPDWERNEFEGMGDEPVYRRRGIEDLSPDYAIDLGEMFRHAQDRWGNVLGPMIGYMVVLFLIAIALNFLWIFGLLIRLAIQPPLMAGFTIVALMELKGRRWTFGDFFSGFNWFGAIWVGTFFFPMLMAAGCVLPGAVMLLAVADSRNDALIYASIGVLIVGYLAAIYLMIRTTMFAIPLIVDRNCGPIEAIKGSWRLTEGHFWGWLGVSILMGLINIGGALLCCVGLLFSWPFTVLALTSAYLTVVNQRRAAEPSPL